MNGNYETLHFHWLFSMDFQHTQYFWGLQLIKNIEFWKFRSFSRNNFIFHKRQNILHGPRWYSFCLTFRIPSTVVSFFFLNRSITGLRVNPYRIKENQWNGLPIPWNEEVQYSRSHPITANSVRSAAEKVIQFAC